MITQLLEGERYRKVRNVALAGLAASLIGGLAVTMREHQKVWINNCIENIAGRTTPPDENTRNLLATSVRGRYPKAEGIIFDRLVERELAIEQSRWDYANRYCPEEAARRALQ